MEIEKLESEPNCLEQEQPDALVNLLVSLKMLGASRDVLLHNFSWCMTQIAGEPNSPKYFHQMAEFAREYDAYGIKRALETIKSTSGIPVTITVPGPKPRREGLLIGLVGIDPYERDTFNGVVAFQNARDKVIFAAVKINPIGQIVFNHVHFQVPQKTLSEVLARQNPPSNR